MRRALLAWLHTASADAEVCAIRFAALSLAPATFGGSLLLLKTAQDLEKQSLPRNKPTGL